MINITEEYINSIAANESAMQNARGLVKKNSFTKLSRDEEATIIFGECSGSGKDNYFTSVDFSNPEKPVFRCSCPSRQIPCKHTLGLMIAYANGKEFKVSPIPEDLQQKREKAEKREAKKAEKDTDKPAKKVNKSALAKKTASQLEGLELLGKLINGILQGGLGALDAKNIKLIEEQAKQLGNYYLTGAQTALREFLLLFKEEGQREKAYAEALSRITTLYAITKKGKEYLEKRLSDPEMQMDKESSIEEWLGHAWQASELRELGLVEGDTELIQLSFNSYEDEARMEFVDEGIWVDLYSGGIHRTFNYRPYRAARHIREDDSFFSVVKARELYIYPGDMNKRVRWEEMSTRELKGEDYIKIKSLAQNSYDAALKNVKNQIKNPLSDKNPDMLLIYKRIGSINGELVTEDESGKRITLKNEEKTKGILDILDSKYLKGQAMLVRFFCELDTGRLYAKPLSIITDKEIIRLVY